MCFFGRLHRMFWGTLHLVMCTLSCWNQFSNSTFPFASPFIVPFWENDLNLYIWDEYVIDMLKGICEKCQESGGIIRFPSLMIWIVMYSLCLVEEKQFQELTKFHMWRFKPFSQKGTMKELANGKVLLENWLQQLKVYTTRWRVPQNIRRSLSKIAHIQLELDHTMVWSSSS